MRTWLALLLAALAGAADIAAEAAATRTRAEADLAAARAAILAERTALAGQLQAAAAEAQAAAQAAQAAAADLARAEAEAPARATALARDLAEVARQEQRLRGAPERLDRLQAEPRGETAVTDRLGREVRVPVLVLGPRRVALGPDPASRGAVVDGRVAGAGLPETRGDFVPVDASGQLAQAREHAAGLAGWLAAGRLFIWPILAVGVLGLVIAAVRLRALLAGRPDRALAATVLSHAREARLGEARAALAGATGDLATVLGSGLDRLADPRPAREAALEAALIAGEPRLTRGLGLLALLAGIAPLLGLLGTVTGMIDLFSVIAAQGAGQSRGLSGGISEALVTTQAGMLVAVPLLVCHAVLARLAERQRLALEEAGAAVLGINHG